MPKTSFLDISERCAHHQGLRDIGPDERDCAALVQDLRKHRIAICILANPRDIACRPAGEDLVRDGTSSGGVLRGQLHATDTSCAASSVEQITETQGENISYETTSQADSKAAIDT